MKRKHKKTGKPYQDIVRDMLLFRFGIKTPKLPLAFYRFGLEYFSAAELADLLDTQPRGVYPLLGTWHDLGFVEKFDVPGSRILYQFRELGDWGKMRSFGNDPIPMGIR